MMKGSPKKAAQAGQAERRVLFGTDGVRGTANVYPMTPEVSLALGQAIARRVLQGRRRHQIVVGKDTRLSGYMFEQALAAGICSMGVDVLLCGPLPTPGIAFLTHSMRADAGAVISASHNPFQDNGIKFFAGDGFKLPDEVELELEAFVLGRAGLGEIAGEKGHGLRRRPTATRIGKASRIDDAVGRYVVHLKHCFPEERTLDGIEIVVDCANGAAYRSAPAVFEELGARVHRLGCKPDGRNINRRCGALHPEHLAAEVQRRGAALGIAVDGDADRVVICDEQGTRVDGDALMAALACSLNEKRLLPKKTLVATVMSNLALDHKLQEHGIRVLRTQVGDRYVVAKMRQGGFGFGGEASGHLIFLQHATTGDGTLAALKVLAMMLESGRPLSELVADFSPYPQVLRSLTVAKRTPLETLPGVVRAIHEGERRLGKRGRVLVRYSGTETVVRVLVEGDRVAKIEGVADAIDEALQTALS